jgi:hypothetical protein
MPDYRNDILGTIYEMESSSGKNKKAYVENADHALGGYQLTRGAFNAVQKADPGRWNNATFEQVAMNDKISQDAAWDYLVLLSQEIERRKLPLTNANLLRAYRKGVQSGIVTPTQAAIDYEARAKALAGIQPNEVW